MSEVVPLPQAIHTCQLCEYPENLICACSSTFIVAGLKTGIATGSGKSLMTSNVFHDYVRMYARLCVHARCATVPQGDIGGSAYRVESLIRPGEWSDSGKFEDRVDADGRHRDFGADPEFTVTHCSSLTAPCNLPDLRRQNCSARKGWRRRAGRSEVNTLVALRRCALCTIQSMYCARTLTRVDGEMVLDDGVLSRDGWAVIDDSDRMSSSRPRRMRFVETARRIRSALLSWAKRSCGKPPSIFRIRASLHRSCSIYAGWTDFLAAAVRYALGNW